jgi:tetratricopeptide (TPR) repeat protein
VATIPEALAIAFAHHQRGELSQAEHIYRQIVAAEPQHADAWHLLGVTAHQAGRNAEAVDSISRALALGGPNAAYLNHLGAAHAGLGNLDLAEAAFRQALQLQAADPQIYYNLAALLNLQDKPSQAIDTYRKAVQLSPQLAEAHFNLGNLLRDQGQPEEAERCYAAALAARPDYLKAAVNLANLQLKLENPTAAEATFRQVLQIDPTHAESHFRLGSLLQSQDRHSEAVTSLQAAVFHNPRHVQAQNNLGCVFRELQQLDQAEQCFRLALDAQPEFAEGLVNLGSVLHDRKQYDAAVDCFRRAIELRPDFVQAYNNLGTVHLDRKQYDLALEQFRKAFDLEPASADALANIGSALQMQGQTAAAIKYHRRAIGVDPHHHRAHYCLGAALHFQGRDEAALESYAEAIRLKPDYAEAYYNRSFVRLGQGDFAAGWQDYAWRFECKDYSRRRFDAPAWDGSPLTGRTLLVHAEQGLGDSLQFIRYVKLAQRRGDNLFVEVPPSLVPLLRASGISGLIAGGSPLPRVDVQIALLNLPRVCGTTLASVPAEVPYLAADPRLLKQWRSRLRGIQGFKIGIVWQGNADYTFDHFRSIPLVQFAPLAEVSGVQLISLQKNAGVEQLSALEGRFTASDLGSTLDGEAGAFMDTAAVMCNLDLVITSDTAAAHLAGGLGVPAWVALASAPEWRWMKDRSDSPWYPTLRLFRQTSPGDWPGVFAQMKTELASRVRQRSPAP